MFSVYVRVMWVCLLYCSSCSLSPFLIFSISSSVNCSGSSGFSKAILAVIFWEYNNKHNQWWNCMCIIIELSTLSVVVGIANSQIPSQEYVMTLEACKFEWSPNKNFPAVLHGGLIKSTTLYNIQLIGNRNWFLLGYLLLTCMLLWLPETLPQFCVVQCISELVCMDPVSIGQYFSDRLLSLTTDKHVQPFLSRLESQI